MKTKMFFGAEKDGGVPGILKRNVESVYPTLKNQQPFST